VTREHIINTYDRVASAFDQIGPRFFSYSGHYLVDLAQIPIKACVLDVATGRGAILFPACAKVGRYEQVIGIDLSVRMLRKVIQDINRKDLGQVKISQMDAEQLGFADNAFDYVFCGHAIYYFPQALQEFYRVLKPLGQVGVSIVAQGCLDWTFEIINHSQNQRVTTEDDQRDNESVAINTVAGLRNILIDAGFQDSRVIKKETDLVYKDEDEWWSVLNTMGVRWAFEIMDTKTLEKVKTEMFDFMQSFKKHDGIHIFYDVLYGFGRKPM
jgi:ubiquinone/menaquinone biosynthesis C-methylase UbiE